VGGGDRNCNPGGAGKGRPEYSEALRGAPPANRLDHGDYADSEYERLRLKFPDLFEGER
jgi:hypothetical protein